MFSFHQTHQKILWIIFYGHGDDGCQDNADGNVSWVCGYEDDCAVLYHPKENHVHVGDGHHEYGCGYVQVVHAYADVDDFP